MRKSWVIISTILALILTVSVGFAESYDSQISSISSSIVEKVTASGKKSVAVADFTDLQGNVTELGRFVAEELSADLINKATKFDVIDRSLLKGILKEHKFSMSGLVDPASLQKLGKIAGVGILITGSITPFGDTIRISCKLIVTDTAKVIGSARGDLAKTKAIEELLTKKIEPGSTIESKGMAVEEPAKITPLPVKPQALLQAQVDKFTFEVKGCNRSEKALVCIMTATNNSQEKRRLVRCSSILYDEKGKQYRSLRNAFFKGDSSTLWVDVLPNLSTTMQFSYEDVDPEAKYADVVITCGNVDSKIALGKIPLAK